MGVWVSSFLLLLTFGLAAQGSASSEPVIIYSSHPVDSLGETVYTHRGKDDSEAIVPGVLVNPKVLKFAKPNFSQALKKKKLSADVTVSGVVTATGIIIDTESNPDADSDAAASALEAVGKYRFEPATLDGKPVATAIKVVVHFKIY